MATPSDTRTTYLVLAIVLTVLSAPTLFYALWAAYDGFVHYPELVQRWNTFQSVQQNDPTQWQNEWANVAKQNGWPIDTPRETSQQDVITQYILMGMCGAMGIGMGVTGLLFFWLMNRGRKNSKHL